MFLDEFLIMCLSEYTIVPTNHLIEQLHAFCEASAERVRIEDDPRFAVKNHVGRRNNILGMNSTYSRVPSALLTPDV